MSLTDGNCFQNLSFGEVSLEDGNQELEENLATNLLNRRAETNSFSRIGLQEKKPHKEARTNSFFTQSFRGILSLCWPIFLLCSFQLVCSALFSKTSFPIQSLHQNQLEAAYSNNFQIFSLQPEELAAAYFSKSFQQESLHQDELTASCFQSPMRARQLSSLQQEELSRSILDDFDQLDLAMSLSFLAFTKNQLQDNSFGRTSFGQMELYSIHQLDLDTSLSYQHFSFHSHSTSFEQRALQCTALLFRIRVCNQKLQTRSVQSFQLTGQQPPGRQFSFSLVSGGAFSTALQTRASPEPWHCPASTLPRLSFEFVHPSCNIALRRRTLPACTLISLSLAITAWLNHAGLRACRGRSLQSSLLATTFPTATSMTTLQTTSFRRAASTTASLAITSRSKRSLRTTSFKRSSSPRASTRTTFRRTSSKRRTLLAMLLFSFLFSIFFSPSFRRKELEKENQLTQTVLDLELGKLVANQTCSLDLYHGHLEQNLWQIQLQQLSLEKNKQKIQKQLSAAVPDRELSQLHLHQLCLQDPASEQDLSNISLDKFFPENFAEQIADKQLQQNLPIDQKQLQKNNLTKNNLQQLSFKKPSFPEKTLNNELAATFAKKSLEEHFAFQTFLFDNLAFQSPASEQLGENNLNQQQLEQSSFTQTEEEACKDQLLSTGFPEASLDQQLFSTSLVQQSGAKAASRPELLHRELPEEELADQNFDKKSFAATSVHTRPSARQLQKNQLEEENFTETSFEALCLHSFPGTACKEELLPAQLLQQQLSSRTFQQNSSSASSFQQQSFRPGTFQPAAWSTGPSDRQLQIQQLDRSNLQQQQLGRNNLQDSSFRKNSFDTNTFENTSFAGKTLAEKSFDQSSFAASSFGATSLEENSFDNSNFQEATFKEDSFQETSLAETSFKAATFDNNSLEKENFPKLSFTESSLEKSSFTKSSFDKKSSLEESSLAESSLATSTSALSSFLQSSLTTNFEKSSLKHSSFTTSSFEESSFAQSSLQESSSKSSFEQSSLEADSFEASFLRSSFQNYSFFEDSLKTTSLTTSSFRQTSFSFSSFRQNSFKQTSFQTNSFQQQSFQQVSLQQGTFQQHSFKTKSFKQNSFQQKSFQNSSFQKHSFQKDSFQQDSFRQHSFAGQSFNSSSFSKRTACTTELRELQRLRKTTELCQLHPTTFRTELSSLKAYRTCTTSKLPFSQDSSSRGLAWYSNPPRGSAKGRLSHLHRDVSCAILMAQDRACLDKRVKLAVELSRDQFFAELFSGSGKSPAFAPQEKGLLPERGTYQHKFQWKYFLGSCRIFC